MNVSTLLDSDQRTAMVLDRMAYEANPDQFVASVAEEQEALRQKLQQARDRLPKVKIPRDVRLKIR